MSGRGVELVRGTGVVGGLCYVDPSRSLAWACGPVRPVGP